MINKFLFIQLFMIGLLLTLTNSCKNDDTTSPNGDGGASGAVFDTTKTYGTMTDQNGNTYKTITIGTQTWMAENLRVTKYRNGNPIPHVTNNAAWAALYTGAYCSYGNTTNKDTIATYGRLYNWYAATDIRNIAPTGWHLPSDAEWIILTTYIGGESIGGKMKEAGTTHWKSPNLSATNESGFTALPSGHRNYLNGDFSGLYGYCTWWSSTASSATTAWFRDLGYYASSCERYFYLMQSGYSVRLIKD